MSKSREVIKKVHQQLDADLAVGDPKAAAFANMLRGELNAARKSLDLSPLPTPTPATGDIWIGSEFRAPANGVLILGESTYDTEMVPETVAETIQNWIRGVRDQTFSRIFNSFSSRRTETATMAERAEFWASVAFCNFVQEAVGTTCDDRPEHTHYKCAKTVLPAVLQHISPRGVLVLGNGQAEYSSSVIRDSGIPAVVCRHPTARGVPTPELQAAWNELQSKIRNSQH